MFIWSGVDITSHDFFMKGSKKMALSGGLIGLYGILRLSVVLREFRCPSGSLGFRRVVFTCSEVSGA